MVFDYTGSGMSDGEYITLGLKESDDLACVVEYLQSENKIQDFALWGRSMGAVTALLFASKYTGNSLKACIYDSPFSSLKKLVKEIASNRTGLPKFVFKPLMTMVDSFMKSKVNISIYDLSVKEKVHLIKVPGLFITSRKDTLIGNHHTEKLFHLYNAEKNLEYINAEHQQRRGSSVMLKCLNFIRMKFNRLLVLGKDSVEKVRVKHSAKKPESLKSENASSQPSRVKVEKSFKPQQRVATEVSFLPTSSTITLPSEPVPENKNGVFAQPHSLLTCKSSKKISLS